MQFWNFGKKLVVFGYVQKILAFQNINELEDELEILMNYVYITSSMQCA